MVYNKKGFSFVSVYKRDIFDKYTLIYWIQESYDIIFMFFSVDSAVQNDNLKFFCKKNIGIVWISRKLCIFAPAKQKYWAMV